MPEDVVVIYTAENEVDALLCKALLEEAGIAVVLRRNANSWTPQANIPLLRSSFELLVTPQAAPQAAALVKDYRSKVESGELQLAEPPAELAYEEPAGQVSPMKLAWWNVLLVIIFAVILILLVLLISQAWIARMK